MKIRAIRIANCGRFREPVAVEGFSGGLDVLIAPNEAGKSTLFEAARLALTQKRTSNSNEIRSLQPYGGGAPLVEIELDVAGERWRLRKRFLADRSAELTSLSGSHRWRGADAETALERLLGAAGGQGRLDLLWLEQGALLDDARQPAAESLDLVRSVIAAEVTSAAGGDRVRRIRGAVARQLGEYVSEKRDSKRGRYLAAETAARRAAEDLAAVRRKLAELEAQLEQLAALELRAAEISDPAVASARRQRLGAAEAALRQAHEDIAGRDAARATAAEARARHEKAAEALRSFDRALDELARLTTRSLEMADETGRLAAAMTVADAERAAAADRAKASVEALEQAGAVLARARASIQWRELSDRVQRARTAASRRAELVRAMPRHRIDVATVTEARRLAGGIAEATARLEAQSAVVVVTYAAGAEGRIRAAGEAVGHGTRLSVTSPLALDIEGVGRMTIEPGLAGDRARLAAELAGHQERLARLLGAAGVETVAALERREVEAREVAACLKETEAELKAVAPRGVEPLEAALVEAEQALGEAGAADAARVDLHVLDAEVVRLRLAAQAAEQQARAVEEAWARLSRDEAGCHARAAEIAARLTALASTLPSESERELRVRELRATADETSRLLDEALRALSAWELRAVDAGAHAKLQAEVVAAREAIDQAAREAAVLAAERSRLEGGLAMASQEDVTSRAAELEVEAERSASLLGDLAGEVAALRLLDAELAAEEARVRDQYLAPVTRRLDPFLRLVFPEGGLCLDAGYGPQALVRAGLSEDVSRLSDGTREQIAILVRLALGRLLAEQGLDVPLILDDALVYSDDARIAAMHRALEQGAEAHQVIVLTCRARSFAGLGGTRVSFRPWLPASSSPDLVPA
ncbi:MAG: AAA family ATPase [Hyphomicrobiaceae bacterium]|nr:AAA family ATPase [Hyphomicrobiaceae bacterium]